MSRGPLPYRISKRNHRWAIGVLKAIRPAQARLAFRVVLDVGKHGLIRCAIPMYLHDYRPGFHPWDEENAGLIAQWQNSAAA